MEILWKSSNFEKQRRKNLPRCNQRDSLRPEDKVPKIFRRIKAVNNFSSRVFSANSCRVHLDPQSENKKPCVSPFEAVCAPPVGWVASIHHRRTETRCWAFVGECPRMILPLGIEKGNTEADAGRLGRSPSLPAVHLPFLAHCFEVFSFGKMPTARTTQKIRRKSRIKGGHHK